MKDTGDMKNSVRRFLNALAARNILNRWDRPPRASDRGRYERAALKAFRSAARRQSIYRDFLSRKGVQPASIRAFRDFERAVPFVSKEEIFDGEGLHGFLPAGSFNDLATLYTSSGFSKRFALGALARGDAARIAFFIEEILFPICGIRERDLLVVNCLSLGTEIPLARHPQAKTGLRSDSVVEVLRRAASEFGGIAIAGEPLFMKRVVEEGTEAGLAWEKMKIWIFTGGEYVSEHWRSYMGSLLRQDPERPENGGIFLTYGLTEFGMAVGFETAPLAALRRALLGEDMAGRRTVPARARPPFMHYLPGAYRLETTVAHGGTRELAVTALDPHRLIPLVRYRTGDEAELYSPEEIGRLLSSHGLSGRKPHCKGLPAVSVHGRKFSVLSGSGATAGVNEIKDALFFDQEVARRVSGNFRLKAGPNGGGVRLLVQLVPGRVPDEAISSRLVTILKVYGAGELAVEVLPYHDFSFGFEHEFERKVPYTG